MLKKMFFLKNYQPKIIFFCFSNIARFIYQNVQDKISRNFRINVDAADLPEKNPPRKTTLLHKESVI